MNKKNVFTLIELLVVIAIIAIIASMLLPALNKAREKAHSTTCLNNQKTLGMTFRFYSDDMGNYYPTYYIKPSAVTWYAVLSEYLIKSAGTKPEWRGWFSPATPYSANKSLAGALSCPSANIEKIWGLDYGENAYLGSSAYRAAADDAVYKYTPFLIDKIKKPSEIFLLGDAYNYGLGDEKESDPTYPARYRHSRGLNLLYVDLHAAHHPDKLRLRPTSSEFGPRVPWIP